MLKSYSAVLSCAECGRRFKEESSSSGFKCSWCVERDLSRKQRIAAKKIGVERDSIRAWRKS
jgi:DNA-directed RNA polymerase subunit RPC12/RpoP